MIFSKLISIFTLLYATNYAKANSFLLSDLNKEIHGVETNPILPTLYHYAELYGIGTCHVTRNPNEADDTPLVIDDTCTASFCNNSEYAGLTFVAGSWPDVSNDSIDNTTFMAGIYDHKKKQNVFIFVGSLTTNNFLLDTYNDSVKYTPLSNSNPNAAKLTCDDCFISDGFYETYKEDYDFAIKTINKMEKEHPDYQLVVLGHSLGAVMAQLVEIDLKLLGYDPLIVEWGCPVFGNKKLIDFFDKVSNIKQSFKNLKSGEFPIAGHIRNKHRNDTIAETTSDYYAYGGLEIYIAKIGDYPTADNIAVCDPSSTDCNGYEESLVVSNTTNAAGDPIGHMVYYVYLGPCGDPISWVSVITATKTASASSSTLATTVATSTVSVVKRDTESNSTISQSSNGTVSTQSSSGSATSVNVFLIALFYLTSLLA